MRSLFRTARAKLGDLRSSLPVSTPNVTGTTAVALSASVIVAGAAHGAVAPVPPDAGPPAPPPTHVSHVFHASQESQASHGSGASHASHPSHAHHRPAHHHHARATDDVGTWIHRAQRILTEHGVHLDASDVHALRLIIRHESGGDPGAVNHADSNAAAGHPSQGLMQTIPATFRAYAVPGHDHDIKNPVANIVAGVRYAVSRYGSLSNVPGVRAVAHGGSYVGY